MDKIELRTKVLISIQRALIGMIYSSIRAIAVGFEDLNKLQITYYLDREPTEEDYESIREVSGEVCADINFVAVEEKCIQSKKPISELDNMDSWVYVRKE